MGYVILEDDPHWEYPDPDEFHLERRFVMPVKAEPLKGGTGAQTGFSAPEVGSGAPKMLDWGQVEEAVKRVQVDAGVYTLRCSNNSVFKATKAGRPAINFLFNVEEDPKADGIFIMAVLPWIVTEKALEHESYARKQAAGLKAGDFEDSGLFVLDALAKAFKFKGSGKVDIEQMIRFFHNKTAKARLKQVQIAQGARKGQMQNEVEEWL